MRVFLCDDALQHQILQSRTLSLVLTHGVNVVDGIELCHKWHKGHRWREELPSEYTMELMAESNCTHFLPSVPFVTWHRSTGQPVFLWRLCHLRRWNEWTLSGGMMSPFWYGWNNLESMLSHIMLINLLWCYQISQALWSNFDGSIYAIGLILRQSKVQCLYHRVLLVGVCVRPCKIHY